MIFNIIIIGSGHAGIEASFSSSKICNKVKLITSNIECIGVLSCNPSIGGIGKSHLVKEIEILGGIMGEVSDYSKIHSKILNYKKGESLHSLRYQIDRILYKNYILKLFFIKKNIFLEQNDILEILKFKKFLILKDKFKNTLLTNNLIICAGTFINSKIYIGKSIFQGGRYNEKTFNISNSLLKMKVFSNKLKTGTPPRIDINFINFKNIEIQYSDYTINYSKNYSKNINIKCFIIYTNKKIIDFIKNNIKKNPMYIGKITTIGPRYCPSIEDRVYKFPKNLNHQIFLEPEGYYNREIYLNGLSTCFSYIIQKKLLSKFFNIKNSNIIRFGYNIEYRFFDPRCLKESLNIKFINNIFLAGQINGTTGYEEASSQGFVAGINAARKTLKLCLWKPKKWNSYIGVLIYDLINKGVQEPYRIFTANSNNRIFLRIDNSFFRLLNIGFFLGGLTKMKFFYYNSIMYNVYKKIFIIKNNITFENYFYFKKILIITKYYGYIKKYCFKF